MESVLFHTNIYIYFTSNPHSEAISLYTSPAAAVAAIKRFPPSSMNLVIASVSTCPPNSSTDGAKTMRFLYKYSPYFERIRLASSASLKVRV